MDWIISFIIAMSTIVGIIALQFLKAKWLRVQYTNLVLKPNCLLTKYPILFIGGQSSLFRLFNDWNDIPDFLREHGYEVFTFRMPSQNLAKRQKALDTYICQAPSKLHIIASSTLLFELENMKLDCEGKIASIHVINGNTKRNLPRTKTKVEDLRPRSQRQNANERPEIIVHQLSTSSPTIEDLDDSNATRSFNGHFAHLSPPSAILRWFSRWLLSLHNLIRVSDRVEPVEKGEPIHSETWQVKARYLELAQKLAEQDFIHL